MCLTGCQNPRTDSLVSEDDPCEMMEFCAGWRFIRRHHSECQVWRDGLCWHGQRFVQRPLLPPLSVHCAPGPQTRKPAGKNPVAAATVLFLSAQW